MQRIATGAATVLLGCVLVIMCLPTWRARWFAGDGETYSYTYHRWFATAIGFFDVAAPIAMLLAVCCTIATVAQWWTKKIGWLAVTLGAVGTVFVAVFGYSEQLAGRATGTGLWVAPLRGLATLSLLAGRLSLKAREHNQV